MRVLLMAILAVAGAVETAWCQNPRPTAAADLAKYLGADRERLLYDGAKKEGKLVWYTSLSSYKEVAKSFEAKYPGVTVEFYRSAGAMLATRKCAGRSPLLESNVTKCVKLKRHSRTCS